MKKEILKSTAIVMFALLMAFNVQTNYSSTNFSFGGLKALANGSSGLGDPCNGTVCTDTNNCTFGGLFCTEVCMSGKSNYGDCEYTSSTGDCQPTGCSDPWPN